MPKSYEDRVEIFKNCIIETMSDEGEKDIRAAILLAHKEYGLNAADSEGGIGSDQAAWQEAAGIK